MFEGKMKTASKLPKKFNQMDGTTETGKEGKG